MQLSESSLIGAFRAYHAFSSSQSSVKHQSALSTTSLLTQTTALTTAEDEASRQAIYGMYLKVVLSLVEDKVERDKEISEELRMEVKGVEDIYEELLLKNTKFPRAEELNEDVLA